jgi:hypothetical protein
MPYTLSNLCFQSGFVSLLGRFFEKEIIPVIIVMTSTAYSIIPTQVKLRVTIREAISVRLPNAVRIVPVILLRLGFKEYRITPTTKTVMGIPKIAQTTLEPWDLKLSSLCFHNCKSDLSFLILYLIPNDPKSVLWSL